MVNNQCVSMIEDYSLEARDLHLRSASSLHYMHHDVIVSNVSQQHPHEIPRIDTLEQNGSTNEVSVSVPVIPAFQLFFVTKVHRDIHMSN